VVALEPGYIFNESAKLHDGWTVRNISGKIEFNLARFPWFGYFKYGTVLVQQFQMQWCRKIIAQEEQRTSRRYLRVARVRTDLLFSGVPTMWSRIPGVPQSRRSAATQLEAGTLSPRAAVVSCRLDTSSRGGIDRELPWGDSASARCAAKLVTEREQVNIQSSPASALAMPSRVPPILSRHDEQVVQACDHYLTAVEANGSSWLTGSDLWLFGSRDVMMGGYLRGLHFLEQTRLRKPNETLRVEHISAVWNDIYAGWQLSNGKPIPLRPAGPCVAATSENEFLRASGSTKRFFWQQSEGVAQLDACLRRTTLAECLRAEEARWAVPLAVLRACIGFEYDFAPGWNSSCSSEDTASDLVRFHARGFGSDLVGDVTSWGKHKMSTETLGYRKWVLAPGHAPSDGF